MKKYIGKILHFDEVGFNEAIRFYQPLIKAINKVAETYEELDNHYRFTNEVFQDIIKNKCVNIKQQYLNLVNEQIEGSKFTSKAINS